MQTQVDQMRASLEAQGHLPEHAEEAANFYVQTQQKMSEMAQQSAFEIQHMAGKQAASEHFAQKYNLGMADLAALRQAETPQSMEELAKRISDDKKVRSELDQLRQAQVPPQQFDNSQGEPQVASNDARLLDMYNAGDRSPNPTAAAKRVAGMG